MDDDALWEAIDTQRTRVADLLEGLDAARLAEPSLCDGWTVGDVGAHLTLQEVTFLDGLRAFLRHPGGLNRTINRTAREESAALTPAEVVARIRAMRGNRRHNAGLSGRETLTDILVHGLDIAIPLGLPLEVPAAAAAEAATRLVSPRGRLLSSVFRRLPLRPYRLVATDHDWSTGSGPEVRGPMVALLLLLTGRTARLGELTGPGADELRARLERP